MMAEQSRPRAAAAPCLRYERERLFVVFERASRVAEMLHRPCRCCRARLVRPIGSLTARRMLKRATVGVERLLRLAGMRVQWPSRFESPAPRPSGFRFRARARVRARSIQTPSVFHRASIERPYVVYRRCLALAVAARPERLVAPSLYFSIAPSRDAAVLCEIRRDSLSTLNLLGRETLAVMRRGRTHLREPDGVLPCSPPVLFRAHHKAEDAGRLS